VISTPEIAQFALGDLAFKVHYPHNIYSSALVKVLWDIVNTILTSVCICPKSSHMSSISLRASAWQTQTTGSFVRSGGKFIVTSYPKHLYNDKVIGMVKEKQDGRYIAGNHNPHPTYPWQFGQSDASDPAAERGSC
jgi:hypothetical protein